METLTKAGNLDDLAYAGFLLNFDGRFRHLTKEKAPLFTTDASDLFQTYLAQFPHEHRQHHNCNSCRSFINRFGGLVTIGSDGHTTPVMWTLEDAPDEYKRAIEALFHSVKRAKVTGVFLSSLDTWGHPETGVWRHLSVTPWRDAVHQHRVTTAGQAMAAKLEDFRNVLRALEEYSLQTLDVAMRLLESEALYRADRVIGPARWLRDLQALVQSKPTVKRQLVWRAIATAPDGFCHPRSSMVGTLLDDITAGMTFEQVSQRFASKMSPSNYQRAQVAPTAGAIAAAERLFDQLGLAPALSRRYARVSEIPYLWRPRAIKRAATERGSVFGHLAPRASTPAAASIDVPAATMTWEKFRRTVMPNADSIEVLIPTESDRLMALVTAADAEAPPILSWDRHEARNPVSWYYAAGIDAEVKRRVVSAGGKYENVDIRASLIWNNRNDLDLHVLTPEGCRVYYGDKRPYNCSGWLDVDMNVNGETMTPVENTRWARGQARFGRYAVQVANYRFHEYRREPTAFRIELEVNGDVFHYDGTVHQATGATPSITAASFIYERAQRLSARDLGPGWRSAGVRHAEWGVTGGALSPVSAITESPNLWGDKPMPHLGRHIFFIVAGCKDPVAGVGRGFFTETLRSDLHAVRSVLEAYNSSATIAGADEADACGIGMSDQAPWNLRLRVTSGGNRAEYVIDRWD